MRKLYCKIELITILRVSDIDQFCALLLETQFLQLQDHSIHLKAFFSYCT